jgi:hypothetical protein
MSYSTIPGQGKESVGHEKEPRPSTIYEIDDLFVCVSCVLNQYVCLCYYMSICDVPEGVNPSWGRVM